jgi:hypothetical protein
VAADPAGSLACASIREDDRHARRESQSIIRVIRPAAEMQKEDKVNADLGQARHDTSDRRTGGHSRSVRATSREAVVATIASPSPRRVRQDIGRPFVLSRCRGPVLVIVTVHR